MKIDSSTVGMESARSYRTSTFTARRFNIMDYSQGLAQQQGNALDTAVRGETGEPGQNTSQDKQKTTNVNEWQNRFGISSSRTRMRTAGSNLLSDIQQMTIRYIFDLLFGASRNRWSSHGGDTGMGEGTDVTEEMGRQNGTGAAMVQNGRPVLDTGAAFATSMRVFSLSREDYFMERESTFFSTTGTVRTSDGREINFNVNVGMSREFEEYYRQDLQLASMKMCDPLVINMDTEVAQLSDQTFFFDIDADGVEDEISRLGSGSGYLALDRDGDGRINDGSELFGASSGNGFADLAEYDEDGNGWIDENDAIWSRLKIWAEDENGRDVLYRLADKGIGAICLQSAGTEFTLKGGQGQTQGAIRRTGVFLYEDGGVGTIQHVDVSKYHKEA